MHAADLVAHRREKRMFSRFEGRTLPVKPDPEDDDIKDYAETTMNELLGWYGYEKVDSRDTQGLNLQHFASAPEGASPPASVREGSDESGEARAAQRGTPNGTRSPNASRPGSASPEVSSLASDEVVRQHQQMVSALSSVTKHPGAPDSPNLPPGCIVCAWCQKVGMKLFTLKTPNGCKAFCSELCFTQCRRASFKKNKICDWCKHVRHTVNYVDFQDGEQQLQFCSDKCLNQYKMNIFCKETQAHLQMHTHLKEAACKMAAGGSVNLITPDLWLRDCKAQSNGGLQSPKEAAENIEDVSDDNISIMPSPPHVPEPPSVSPVVIEKGKNKSEYTRPAKMRDKLSRRSGRGASKSPHDGNESRLHNHKTKERKSNGIGSGKRVEVDSVSAGSRIPLSLRSSFGNAIVNGPTAVGGPNRSPQLHHTLPPRLCPPRLDGVRPPFMPPSMMPSPMQVLAQQQMESLLRSQSRMGMPPGEHLPIPPWSLPPFPHGPPPPPPHHPLPIPAMASNNLQMPHPTKTSRSESHSLHKSHKSGHSKSRHARHSASSVSRAAATPPPKPPQPSSLLPPVTVMVPFPVVLPLPLPIPILLPVPEKLFEKLRKEKVVKAEAKNLNEPPTTNKNTSDVPFRENDSIPLNLNRDCNNLDCSDTSGRSASVPCPTDPEELLNGKDSLWASGSKTQPRHPDEPVTTNEISYTNRSSLSDPRMEDSCSFSSLSENVSFEEEDDETGDEVVDEVIPQMPFPSHLLQNIPKSSLPVTSSSTTGFFPSLSAEVESFRLRTPSPVPSSAKKRRSSFSSSHEHPKRHCAEDGPNQVEHCSK